MEAVEVGVRAFREKLAGYFESGTPLAIMQHGEALGYYTPAIHREGFDANKPRQKPSLLYGTRSSTEQLRQPLLTYGYSVNSDWKSLSTDAAKALAPFAQRQTVDLDTCERRFSLLDNSNVS